MPPEENVTVSRIGRSSTVLPSPSFTKPGLYSVALLPLAFLAGCMLDETGYTSADYYYLNPYKNLSTIGSVVLVELRLASDTYSDQAFEGQGCRNSVRGSSLPR